MTIEAPKSNEVTDKTTGIAAIVGPLTVHFVNYGYGNDSLTVLDGTGTPLFSADPQKRVAIDALVDAANQVLVNEPSSPPELAK